jgi:hypothetical protein
MSPVNTIAPVTGVAQVTVDRLPSIPVAEAVATVLAPAKTITATNNAAASDNDTFSSSSASSDSNYQHSVVLDPATQDLIFRVVDVRSRQVVRQVPEEALLRMRAYARALTDGKSNTEALNQANLEA